MKVLLIFFGNDYHGGTIYSTFALAKGLAARGHEVHALVHPTPEGRLVHDLEGCGVKVHEGTAPIVVRPIWNAKTAFGRAREVVERGRWAVMGPACERAIGDIVDTHGIDLLAIPSGAVVSGARTAQRLGIPYVWHIREFMQEDQGYDYYPWAHAYELMEGASSLICVSEAVRNKITSMCSPARAEVVYNGIDPAQFYPGEAQDAPRPANAPVRIMFSGGIKRAKGTFTTVEALARLDAHIPMELDIFGREGTGDESAPGFAAYCDTLGIAGKVRYRGYATDMAAEYRCHDLLIVASHAEAFGRTTAEAMLSGCPVVGSRSGGTPELIADGRGYLFEPDDPDSLAEALTQALGDARERQAVADRALAYAREHFSVDAYVDKVEAIYQAAVS